MEKEYRHNNKVAIYRSADGETAAVEKKDGQMVEINGELQKITGVKTVSGLHR